MNCVYHPANLAHVRCSSCGRGLCPACDHRIKGMPCCQECIVAGIEMLRRGRNSGRDAGRERMRVREKSPGIATVLALIPGLGAAYNGQNIKALVHFVTVAGLWHMADIMSRPFEAIFALAGIAFYLYTIYDARHSAERQRSGEDLREDEIRLRQSLREHAPLWGLGLIGLGVISFLHVFFDAQLYGLGPLLLIAAGIYLLRGLRRIAHPDTARSTYKTPPPSVIVSPYEGPEDQYAGLERRRFDRGR